MQIFVSDKGYVKVYPMKSLTEYPSALQKFAKGVGAPDILVADPHKSHASKEVMDFCNKIGTTLRLLEKKTQWDNRSELYVGVMKEAVRKYPPPHQMLQCMGYYPEAGKDPLRSTIE